MPSLQLCICLCPKLFKSEILHFKLPSKLGKSMCGATKSWRERHVSRMLCWMCGETRQDTISYSLVLLLTSVPLEIEITEQFYFIFMFQEPRPLSQFDLENALSTSRTTAVASEYGVSSSRRTFPGESVDYQGQAAINEFSKLMVSYMLNLQSDSQDS